MSKIALSGNASGTGTLTLSAPNTNSDRVLNLPDNSGTVLTTATPGVPVNGPAFRANLGSNQTIASNNTWTKLQFSNEVFDTNNNYDTSNHRFTPSVAGYYQVSAAIRCVASAALSYAFVGVYKNGSVFQEVAAPIFLSSFSAGGLSGIVYLNGTGDYVEVYAFVDSSGTKTVEANANQTTFQAALIRSAV